MQRLLSKIAKGQKTSKDLTWEEAKQAMRLMIEGTATPVQVGAFLVAMRYKSESVTELAAFTATLDGLWCAPSSMASVPTGMPPGICTIESNESMPFNA